MITAQTLNAALKYVDTMDSIDVDFKKELKILLLILCSGNKKILKMLSSLASFDPIFESKDWPMLWR